jgi:hypothetical protein
MFMIPGDQGRVFSNADSQGMMGNTTINVNVYGAMAANPQAIAGAVAKRLSPRG